MSVLLRILVYIVVSWWVLRRIIGFFLRKPAKPANSGPEGTAPQDTVKDPVCGMYMDPRLAIRLTRKEGDVFFCSEECRRRYLSGQI